VVEEIVDFVPIAVLEIDGERGIITGIQEDGVVDVLGHVDGFLETPAVVGSVDDVIA
jgi:hypothetical protein